MSIMFVVGGIAIGLGIAGALLFWWAINIDWSK